MNNTGREKNNVKDNTSTQESKEDAVVDFRLDGEILEEEKNSRHKCISALTRLIY